MQEFFKCTTNNGARKNVRRR